MAVVFAGNGIFELQSSGILKVTPVAWLWGGIPSLGLHPNVQVVSVQALLVAGALLALVLAVLGASSSTSSKRAESSRSPLESPPKAGVGV